MSQQIQRHKCKSISPFRLFIYLFVIKTIAASCKMGISLRIREMRVDDRMLRRLYIFAESNIPVVLKSPGNRLFDATHNVVNILLVHDYAALGTSSLRAKLGTEVVDVNFTIAELLHRLQAIPVRIS